jgi:hypothetical protein
MSETSAEVRRCSPRHLPDRTKAIDNKRAILRHVGVAHCLPGGRENVGEKEETLVRRTFRHLDRPERPPRSRHHVRPHLSGRPKPPRASPHPTSISRSQKR